MTQGESIAIVCTNQTELSVGPIVRPSLGPHDVLIRTIYSGVSTGTDKWVMQGRFTWRSMTYPLVPGYQRSGIVEEVGALVTSFAPGQFVVATASENYIGVEAHWGAHVSLAASPESEVFDATGVSPLTSAFVVSAQVGFNASSRITASSGSHVIVIGDGIIGASAALAAKARGYEVLLLGRHDDRLDAIAALGITTANTRHETPPALESWKPTAAIDTIQSDQSFGYYIDLLPECTGEVVFSGHSPDDTKNWGDMEALQKRELTAHFVSGWRSSRLEETLALMRQGQMALESLVGTVATTAESAVSLMTSVRQGTLGSLAAAIDWRSV